MQSRGISPLSLCVTVSDMHESRQAPGPEGRHARSSGSLQDSHDCISLGQ